MQLTYSTYCRAHTQSNTCKLACSFQALGVGRRSGSSPSRAWQCFAVSIGVSDHDPLALDVCTLQRKRQTHKTDRAPSQSKEKRTSPTVSQENAVHTKIPFCILLPSMGCWRPRGQLASLSAGLLANARWNILECLTEPR